MGSSHIAIPALLKVGRGALEQIGSYIKAGGMERAVVYFGNGLVEMFGAGVMASLKKAEVEVLEYRELDSIRIEDIVELAFSIAHFRFQRRLFLRQRLSDSGRKEDKRSGADGLWDSG